MARVLAVMVSGNRLTNDGFAVRQLAEHRLDSSSICRRGQSACNAMTRGQAGRQNSSTSRESVSGRVGRLYMQRKISPLWPVYTQRESQSWARSGELLCTSPHGDVRVC